MGYCIDDICHNAGPICGAGSPYHCRADGGPPADHYCDDPGCETCMPWDDDDYDDDYPGEPIQPGDEHYYRLPAEEPEGPEATTGQPYRDEATAGLWVAATRAQEDRTDNGWSPCATCGGKHRCEYCPVWDGAECGGCCHVAEEPEAPPERDVAAEIMAIDEVAIARSFHGHYERLAPEFGYQTRPDSACRFDDVPEPNRSLMVTVAGHVRREIADHFLPAAPEATPSLPRPRLASSDGTSRSATRTDGPPLSRSRNDRPRRAGQRNDTKGTTMPERKGKRRSEPDTRAVDDVLVGWLLGEEDAGLNEAEPLFRAAAALSESDREQVLRFAEFLAAAGKPGASGRRAGRANPAGGDQ